MPIEKLPPATFGSINASQILTDSASVVKELVDNAIDARATAIYVEISTNTLNVIQVKDNGYGIAGDDRNLICKRSCTSKIRDLNDLRDIGGKSLGFRGEALASAAEMSESLEVSSRVDGEPMALHLRFDRQGQIQSEKSISLPVGTVVRVTSFLKYLPVRKQEIEKAPIKILSKIKKTLQSYALARPHIKFSLKVLKAKNEKGNWMYSPKLGAMQGLKGDAITVHAVTDLFGRKLMDQCQWTSSAWSRTGEQIEATTAERIESSAEAQEVYCFQAILAKSEGDISVVSNMGQHVSIDSRPVSCTRGVLKKLATLYKSCIKTSSSVLNPGNERPTDPFLYMNITCPPRSYDANVEPAKDDVIFVDADLILQLAEKFFKKIYGETKKDDHDHKVAETRTKVPGFEVMLAKKTARHDPQALQSQVGPTSQSTSESLGSKRELPASLVRLAPLRSRSPAPNTGHCPSIWQGSMCGEDDNGEEDEMEHFEASTASKSKPLIEEESDDGVLQDNNVSNPWIFAKLNAHSRRSEENISKSKGNSNYEQLPTPNRQRGDVEGLLDPSSDDVPPVLEQKDRGLPTPNRFNSRELGNSSVSPTTSFPYPLKARGKRRDDDAVDDARSRANALNKERYGNGALDTWVQRSLQHYPETIGSVDESEATQKGQGSSTLLRPNEFVSAASMPFETPSREAPDINHQTGRKVKPRKQQRDNINKPFISPVNDPERVWFDVEEHTRSRHPKKNSTTRSKDSAPAPILRDKENNEFEEQPTQHPPIRPTQSWQDDLAATMDYEARKQEVTQQRKEFLRRNAIAASQSAHATISTPVPPTTNSPHTNRYNKAIAALHAPSTTSSSSPNLAAFAADDPRIYLIRAQQRGGQPSNRRNTARLPFETRIDEASTHNLVLDVKTSVLDISNIFAQQYAADQYIVQGTSCRAFASPISNENVRIWEARIRRLVRRWYRVEAREVVNGNGNENHVGDALPILNLDLSQPFKTLANGTALTDGAVGTESSVS